MRRVVRREDNIPSIKDYEHWNEEAARIWYEENKYDMNHPDEIISDDWDGPDDFDGEEEESE